MNNCAVLNLVLKGHYATMQKVAVLSWRPYQFVCNKNATSYLYRFYRCVYDLDQSESESPP